MNGKAVQTALRETQRALLSRHALAVMAGLSVILAIVGPYETHALLTPLQRLGYWLLAVGLSGVAGTFAPAFLTHAVPNLSPRLRAPAAAAGTATLVLCGVLVLNGVVFGTWPGAPGYLRLMLLTVGGVSFILSLVLFYYEETRHAPSPEAPSPEAPPATESSPPRLLSRLAEDQRGELVSISVRDHYVEVTTTQGTGQLLMRLSDAMAETARGEGLQVHRSHWVSRAHVTCARRDGARACLTLSDGREIPASRTYLPALKEAGLLPATHG
ncbi:LytTR family DNA-binding domain-containing protein [Pseudoroseicyclus tamaricis]|uniref:LytTR family transcriptional regulator n=1 Tax=Pseudoroseicyclus tamaricis TaxID=2705421 RepID=A0A6B2JUM0_9RHOB|nr:LytTR family DNA-binding domain-containing protein [Pseudoroseicyclus tamaricis]NDV02018.1 LytTR family transcriptional regulator [Pseudoroseicyclus tamaricis]